MLKMTDQIITISTDVKLLEKLGNFIVKAKNIQKEFFPT
jgi:hypothetical protein